MGFTALDLLIRERALMVLEWGTPSDAYTESPPFTRFALLHRVAFCLTQLRERSIVNNNTTDQHHQLELAILEFERWYEGQDYNTAAQVLLQSINPLLLRWGYYHLILEQHKRLENRLSDSLLQSFILNNIGLAYLGLGNCQTALLHFKQALETAQQDKYAEALSLNNIGACYDHIGQIDDAIKYYNKARAKVKEVKKIQPYGAEYQRLEGICLSNLGVYYEYLGKIDKAIGYHTKAKNIACKLRDWETKVQSLGNLGDCYATLGDFDNAEYYYQQALEIIQKYTGNQIDKGTVLYWWAEVLIDQSQYPQALKLACEGAKIGKKISNPKLESWNNSAIARAYLHLQKLNEAHEFASIACQHNTPQNNYYAQTLLGLIKLRRGDKINARDTFQIALNQASELLKLNQYRYQVRLCKD